MTDGPPPADATGAAPDAEATPHGSSPAGATAGGDPFEARPELFVGGAFVGGFALAMLLKRLGS